MNAPRRIPIHLNCPHCHNPIELVAGEIEDEVQCPSCGSSFRLDPDRTRPHDHLRQVGKFELIGVVGRGAFGTVYRARDTQLHRTVAVKVPRSGQLTTREDEDRFVREARNAAQLQHSGIVPVYEVGRSMAFTYIVSEFVEGNTLADALTARRFGFRESAQLVAQVAVALQHAHDQGVVHRDLKPSNIMLTPDGIPRVMDFGLAKRDAGEITMTIEGQVLGTPAYMSPEQASGQAHHVDGRSDVYSLGVILFELLTGELPFRGNSRMLLQQVMHDEPRSPRSLNDRIPRDLETICLKAMAKEPGRRYTKAQAMTDDLGHWLRDEPIVARPVDRVERSWRWCRRNPVVAVLSAVIVLMVVVGTSLLASAYFSLRSAAASARVEKSQALAAKASAEAEKARADQKADEAERNATAASEATSKATEEARRAVLEAEKATRVAQFLANMFDESAPLEIAGLRFGITEKSQASANLTAREILDRGSQRVTSQLKGQPVIQAALMETMGNVYLGLGVMDQAELLLQEALDLRQRHLPQEHLDIASSMNSIGVLRFVQGRYRESVVALWTAYNTRRKLLGDDNEQMDASRMVLGAVSCLQSGAGGPAYLEARELLCESLAWRRKHFGNEHRETAFAMLGVAVVSTQAEAMKLLLEAAPILSRDPTAKSIGIAMTQGIQALMLGRFGPKTAFVAATRKAVAAARDVGSDAHPFVGLLKEGLAKWLIINDELDEAEKLIRENISAQSDRKIPITNSVDLLKFLADNVKQSDPARAATIYRELEQIHR